ncbi:uncharacterized protein N0V89_010761 [Didymosphaeria variabile]|uniref:Uncharacterized protein n=1 Tax=Didymosphaeria variabile TaxID=1932322 RepID=A0A9W8XDH6_9PLEO|nr:uncharacterized protein N0V89_010761 [Didymosphaeria variabile]KAJ4346829.1 hypothetical protein N0V89_010761 [Didymosphaeria variabile]
MHVAGSTHVVIRLLKLPKNWSWETRVPNEREELPELDWSDLTSADGEAKEQWEHEDPISEDRGVSYEEWVRDLYEKTDDSQSDEESESESESESGENSWKGDSTGE